ncbi:MAG: LysR substrate-binding domain-containing protein [Pseudomonadota bacterium]
MDLNALADFNLVATHGGFGRASRASKRSKATLSRRIAALEAQLGVRLIERGATGLELTEAGQLLLGRTEGPMNELADAFGAARDTRASPRGQLRIAAPGLFSQLAMGQLCARFRLQYPDITLEVVAEDRVVDLVQERFDVAIRPNPRPDTALVGRCFAKDRQLVVAAPGLAKPAPDGQPVRVPAVVMATPAGAHWEIDEGALVVEPVPVMRLSSLLMVRDAAVAGAGVALLPYSLVWQQLQRGELLQWGAPSRKEVELWVLHTSRRLASPKVNAFVEFMCQQYPAGTLLLPA